MFLRDVLGYSLDTAGFLAAFPYILMAVVVQVDTYLQYLLSIYTIHNTADQRLPGGHHPR